MIRSKNNGFTLIEVLFALTIIGMAITPLIVNQGNLIGRVGRQARNIFRIYLGEAFMIDSFLKFQENNAQRTASKQNDDPEAFLKFRIDAPNPTLKKEFRNVYKQQVTVEWKEEQEKYSSNLVTFIFLPELEEKK